MNYDTRLFIEQPGYTGSVNQSVSSSKICRSLKWGHPLRTTAIGNWRGLNLRIGAKASLNYTASDNASYRTATGSENFLASFVTCKDWLSLTKSFWTATLLSRSACRLDTLLGEGSKEWKEGGKGAFFLGARQ